MPYLKHRKQITYTAFLRKYQQNLYAISEREN